MRPDLFTVLMVDDEIELCALFRLLFETPEIKIVTFSNPIEALRSTESVSYDVVFVDYRMPDLLGDEFAKRLPVGTKAILMSGEPEAKPTFNFFEILSKPFEHERIAKILSDELLAKRKVLASRKSS